MACPGLGLTGSMLPVELEETNETPPEGVLPVAHGFRVGEIEDHPDKVDQKIEGGQRKE